MERNSPGEEVGSSPGVGQGSLAVLGHKLEGDKALGSLLQVACTLVLVDVVDLGGNTQGRRRMVAAAA